MLQGRSIAAAALLLLSATSAALPAQVSALSPNGTALNRLAPPNTIAVVLYFVATDCPICNRTFPEMQRLRREFTDRHISFWYVYPNQGETALNVRHHQQAFDPGGQTLLDPQGSLVALTHARVTPEVAVLIPDASAWRTVYAGRIDDRYIRLGLQRPQATQFYAEQVLHQVLSHHPVQPAVGQPVGCAIMNPQAPAGDPASAATMPGMAGSSR